MQLSPNRLRDLLGLSDTEWTLLRSGSWRASQAKLFELKSKSGKPRKIHSCSPKFKRLLQRLAKFMEQRFSLPPEIIGGRPGRQLVDHVRPHIRAPLIITADIKGFYPSTSKAMIVRKLVRHGWGKRIAKILAEIVTSEDQLPQGYPTSLIFAYISLLEEYRHIIAFAKSRECSVTFWVDDLAISGSRSDEVLEFAKPRIQTFGYVVHKEQRFDMSRQSARITGVVITRRGIRLDQAYEKAILLNARHLARRSDSMTNRRMVSQSINGKLAYAISINRARGSRLVGRVRDLLVAI